MSRYRFAVIGSGWRAQYYVRAAKALPDLFELCSMYCRSEEKAARIRADYDIPATASEDECASANPDFVVTAVSKSSGPEVAMHWMDRGFSVLCETPAGQDLETLNTLWMRHEQGQKLVIAEQYFLYPVYSSLIKLVKSGIIGETSCLNISLAHEYHGASLIRALLGISPDMPFTVSAKRYKFPVTETRTRYDEIKDGRIAMKKRTVSTFEFENGQIAFYDFDSEQYHSKIRRNSYKLQGERGEIQDNNVVYLNPENDAIEAELQVKTRRIERDFANPNPEFAEEVVGIFFQGEQLYEPPFGPCGLSQDETAVAQLMKKTAEYARGIGESPFPLKEALQDAYMSVLMKNSIETGKLAESEQQLWM
jgi:predicted dehydrogenase